MQEKYTDRGSQIADSVRWALNYEEEYIRSLKNIPALLDASARKLFMDEIISGYHPSVIRAAIRDLDREGWINIAAPAYEEELLSTR
jgi:hypothetical protein